MAIASCSAATAVAAAIEAAPLVIDDLDDELESLLFVPIGLLMTFILVTMGEAVLLVVKKTSSSSEYLRLGLLGICEEGREGLPVTSPLTSLLLLVGLFAFVSSSDSMAVDSTSVSSCCSRRSIS